MGRVAIDSNVLIRALAAMPMDVAAVDHVTSACVLRGDPSIGVKVDARYLAPWNEFVVTLVHHSNILSINGEFEQGDQLVLDELCSNRTTDQ